MDSVKTNMEMYVDIACRSLFRYGEELCGDKAQITTTENSVIAVLSDGLGSGVKANILSTLTSSILATMLHEGAAIEQAVETVVNTLPVCSERNLAYSTFSVLQIFHDGNAYLVEFDNPPVSISGMERCWNWNPSSGKWLERKLQKAILKSNMAM